MPKDDFGLYLFEQSKKMKPPHEWLFNQYLFYNLTVVTPDKFIVDGATATVGGQTYSTEIWFDRQIFDKILTLVSHFKSRRLARVMEIINKYPAKLLFDQSPLCLDILVKLGDRQQDDEGAPFIPLVVVDVSAPAEALSD